MCGNILEKVTCFITRERNGSTEVLLFQHPYAGIQFPAGTVEIGEDPEQAALREAFEETGLSEFLSCSFISSRETYFPGDNYITYRNAKVYSRPDLRSSSWAEIRRGITVQHERKEGDFIQVSYIEEDRYPEPNYISFQITGWVETTDLAAVVTRHFYHLRSNRNLTKWEHEADDHIFSLFWAPLEELPEIVTPQQEWIQFLLRSFQQ